MTGVMVGASSLSASLGALAAVGNRLSIFGVFPSSVMPVRPLYSVLFSRLSQTVMMMSPAVPPAATYLFFAIPATTSSVFVNHMGWLEGWALSAAVVPVISMLEEVHP